MTRRFLDCSATELAALDKKALLQSLKASEGRVLMSESIVAVQPFLHDVTNAELAASQGADLLLLNMFDAEQPVVQGMPAGGRPQETIRDLQRLTGRVIGVNLEAVDPESGFNDDEFWRVSPGRAATALNARRLVEMGARFLVLTGNPANGVSNRAINHSLREIKEAVGAEVALMTGKMHSSGVVRESGAKILSCTDVESFVANGADVILLPAPGTVPGMSVEAAQALIARAHELGAMAMTAIGTSQEGSDTDTIRRIALMSKMAGADLHHIGDTGYFGIALPENILAYGIAIRGIRHTYARMARSINR